MWYNSGVTLLYLLVALVLGSVVTNLCWFVFYRKEKEQKFYHPVKKLTLDDWADLAGGTSGDLALEQAWLRKFQEMYVMFCNKQHDYGPTNIATGGLKGVAIRMGDKMSRLWTLTGLAGARNDDGNAVSSETIRDTLFDLADYGIIGLMVYDKDWPTMHPSEVWGLQALKVVGRLT